MRIDRFSLKMGIGKVNIEKYTEFDIPGSLLCPKLAESL